MLLPALAFVIGAIGLGLTLAFARLVLQANRSINVTKRYRSKAPGWADLLNYGAIVDDGVIACKNGALLAAWE
jgi:type IV secretion system protein TrbE